MKLPFDIPWTPAPLRRKELIAAGVFLAIFFGPTIFFTDIYPLTRTPMFSDKPQRFYVYEVAGPDGSPIDPATLGLNYTYDGNPPDVGFGWRRTQPISSIEEDRSEGQVTAWVQPRLAKYSALPYVTVTQKVIASQGQPIGVVRSATWRIANPAYGK